MVDRPDGQRPKCQRVVLRQRPRGPLDPADLAIEEYSVPEIEDGEFLVRNLFLSVDPMNRLHIDGSALGGAVPLLPLGATIPGAAVGEIVASKHPDFAVGEVVEGRFGWQHYGVSRGDGVRRVNPALGGPENALGVGGLPGFTAFIGLHSVGGVKPGQTVLVSGAAGAVGSVVGALVKARGGRAVAIASGEKRDYLMRDIGYDAVVDRKSPDFPEQLRNALPDGADVYFDNVGGPMLAKIVPLMARGGTILICGLMALYEPDETAAVVDHLPPVLWAVMGKSLRIQGFGHVGNEHLRPAFEAEMADLLGRGALKVPLQVRDGIEQVPQAMWGLFNQSVPGKVVIRVGERSQDASSAQI